MRIGFHLVRFDWADQPASIPRTLRRVAEAAEAVGASDLTVMDHWFQIDGFAPVTDPMLEGYTTLGYLAACTTTLRLGLLVTGVTYRHPGVLAKTVATLDVLSEGRAQLGIGAAWYEREHTGLGLPFPPLSERFERLEETLQICKQMWSGDDGPFDGRHYHLAETICAPRPVEVAGPRILIGGGGERKTLRLVAAYADAWNMLPASVDEVAHKVEVLQAHCETEGRDPDTIHKTILSSGDPLRDPSGFLASMATYRQLGFEQVVLVPAGDPVTFVEAVGSELVPALAEI